MYIYESHLGGFYASDEPLDYDMLYCETCGDSDFLLGYADTVREALDVLVGNVYGMEYVKEFIGGTFGVDLKISDGEPDIHVQIVDHDGKKKLFCQHIGGLCPRYEKSDVDDWEEYWCWDCEEPIMQELERLNPPSIFDTTAYL